MQVVMSKDTKSSGSSPLLYTLEALIPYSDANLNLTFRPHAFFNELDRRSKHSRSSLESAYYRARRHGLIEIEGTNVSLSNKALRKLGKTNAAELPAGSSLMVIFDIPEEYALKRRQLRSLLRELKFQQEQRSVWISSFDYRAIVLDLIEELRIALYAKVFISQEVH